MLLPQIALPLQEHLPRFYLREIFVSCQQIFVFFINLKIKIVPEDICPITNDLDLNQNKEAVFSPRAQSFSNGTNLFSVNKK